jgi:hypothetical protein
MMNAVFPSTHRELTDNTGHQDGSLRRPQTHGKLSTILLEGTGEEPRAASLFVLTREAAIILEIHKRRRLGVQ